MEFGHILALHIISIISWMAGLLYLPRLFVYHTETEFAQKDYNRFVTMEKKLLFYISIPAMILSAVTGIYLAYYTDIFVMKWFHIKSSFVLLLIIFQIYCINIYFKFKKGTNQKSKLFFKIINEIPTIAMIFIVWFVVNKF